MPEGVGVFEKGEKMMEENKTTGLIGEDVKKLPVGQLLKRIGPGLIATGIVIGPGAVTTAAMLGANYGYSLIWLIFPIIFMGITFVMTTNWLATTTGMPTIHAIRKYFGKPGAIIVGIALVLSCLFLTMGNISGTGAGMNLVFGIDWKLGSLIMIVAVVVTYFLKNVYSKVEKLITVCIGVMIIAFYVTLFGVGGPDAGELGKGLFSFQIPEGSLGTALAFISTNAAITTGIYNTYLGKEKKWKREDLFNGVMFTDALVHMISVILISGAIILVGAIVLHPQGLSIKAPAQLAQMLEPIMGNAARYIMGAALLGAGFSSLLANTQRGPRQKVQPGKQIHPLRMPGLPGDCHDYLLQFQRFPHGTDPDCEYRHVHRDSGRRALRPAADLAQGREQGIQSAYPAADLHDYQLYLRADYDGFRVPEDHYPRHRETFPVNRQNGQTQRSPAEFPPGCEDD